MIARLLGVYLAVSPHLSGDFWEWTSGNLSWLTICTINVNIGKFLIVIPGKPASPKAKNGIQIVSVFDMGNFG